MPTPAEIRARLTIAQTTGQLTSAEQADLLNLAITEAIADGLPYINQGADGVNESRMSVADAVAMRDRLRAAASGGIVAQFAEFTDG